MKLSDRPAKSEAVIADELKSAPRVPFTVNPGDRISKEPQTIEEKAKQIAVEAPDIAGDHIKVPTYFIFEMPDGEKKALHHVRDAKQISDLIRQAFFYAEYDRDPEPLGIRQYNVTAIILIVVSFVITLPILAGIF